MSLAASDTMFALLFDLEDYATTYRATRDAYLKAANELKLATGPYKAARLCSGAPAWGVPTTQRPRGGPPSRSPPTTDIYPSFCSFLRKDFLRRHRDGQFRNFFFKPGRPGPS